MKTILATLGAAVVIMSTLGMFGIGNFYWYYGESRLICFKANQVK